MENTNIPTLRQINGALEFTESSLSAKNIKANALAHPWYLILAQEKTNPFASQPEENKR